MTQDNTPQDKDKMILHCAECEKPLMGGYCYNCRYAPSMQDTYLAVPKN